MELEYFAPGDELLNWCTLPVLFIFNEYIVTLSGQWGAKIMPDRPYWFVSNEDIAGYFSADKIKSYKLWGLA